MGTPSISSEMKPVSAAGHAATDPAEELATLAPLSPWCTQDESRHSVQFYDSDQFFVETWGRMIGTVLGAGDVAIVIATQSHRDAVAQLLSARGLDVAVAVDQGHYIALDAAEMLATFMVDGMPDAVRFTDVVGGVLARAAESPEGKQVKVSAFGEMVAVLVAEGKPEAAIRLELLWNQLARERSFLLHCAYPMHSFCRKEDSDSFLRVCAEHTAIIPTEHYTRLSSEGERLRSITELQQKAHALEAELAERTLAKARSARLESENGQLVEEIRKRERAEDGLRTLAARLLTIRDEERRRVARELYDGTAQVLAALAINLGIVEIEKDFLSRTSSELLAQSTKLVHNLLHDVRSLSQLLHPPTLDDMGIISAIQWYVERFMERSPVRVEVAIPEDLGRLPREVEIAVFRVVQESLTNVHHHSGSKTASVRVGRSPREVVVEVRDQGKGIPPEVKLAGKDATARGVGISGMRERVRQLGGTVSVDSDDRGSIIRATLPLA
ncbi:MAG TPA: MEDS domain-containing protein [Terriglobales bacterium]|nr:MEDS domain-containing protein [Terriglobales bacterium]